MCPGSRHATYCMATESVSWLAGWCTAQAVWAVRQPLRKSAWPTRRSQPSAHLAVKAVHLVHALALVVASAEVHVAGVEDLEGKEREDDLQREGGQASGKWQTHARLM